MLSMRSVMVSDCNMLRHVWCEPSAYIAA